MQNCTLMTSVLVTHGRVQPPTIGLGSPLSSGPARTVPPVCDLPIVGKLQCYPFSVILQGDVSDGGEIYVAFYE